MARYLITGGAGFIGSHLCDALIAEGHELVLLDDLSSGNERNIAAIRSHVELIVGGLDAATLARAGGAFDAVFHLAALISGFDSLLAPDDYADVNIRGLLRVIDFVAQRGIARLVFASSSTVYGNRDSAALTEAELPAPLSVYAATKLMGEQLIAMYAQLHGFSHCSLRLFNVYGPRQAIDHAYANVTCKFAHAAAHALPIKLYGDGSQTRDFIYVADVVRALVRVAAASPSVLYNIGSGSDASIGDLIAMLEAIAGQRFAIDRQPPWPNDIKRIAADITRGRTELGFVPMVAIREGLERTVAFHAS